MATRATAGHPFDTVVVGGGNAALCAALAARESGARVLLLEKAPPHERGGNSFFTAGGFRFAHAGLEDLRQDVLVDVTDDEAATLDVPPYTSDQFRDDLMRLTDGLSDPDMADILINRSRPTVVWMRGHGVRWILMMARQSYHVGGKHRFWGVLNVEAVGGGPGLIEALYEVPGWLGVDVRYGTRPRGSGWTSAAPSTASAAATPTASSRSQRAP
jgi:tricarballylate dehydrogenase